MYTVAGVATAGSGIALAVLAYDLTPSWPAALRLAVIASVGSLTMVGSFLTGGPSNSIGYRSIVRPRRMGEKLPQPWGMANHSATSFRPTVSPQETSFAIGRTNSLITLVGAGLAMALVIPLGMDALDGELSIGLFYAALFLGPATILFVRSTLRSITSGRALRFDAEGLTLGWALGFLPPLRIDRNRLTEVIDRPGLRHLSLGGDIIAFVVDQKLAYPVNATHLEEPSGPIEWITVHWPEIRINRQTH